VTGLAAEHGGALPWTVVIVNASCTFLRPLVFPGDVEIRMLLAHPGRTSVASFYDIVHAGEICAEGAAKIVFVDAERGRPVPLPAGVASMLQDMVREEAR
jgi:acyl-CoA thioester hydrolase